MFIQDIESCRAIHSTESSSTLLPTATRDVLNNLTIPQQTMSRSHLKTCPHESGVSRGAGGGGVPHLPVVNKYLSPGTRCEVQNAIAHSLSIPIISCFLLQCSGGKQNFLFR